MNRSMIFLVFFILLYACDEESPKVTYTTTSDRISIFEIYFKEPKSVDQFGAFLKDTLKLPVEWEPFDFFGNGVVYDAAYHFGNTTLELLSLTAGDSTMDRQARFNRVLFASNDIKIIDDFLIKKGIQHSTPFNFNIVSDSSNLQIGNQINLDSLSMSSKINIAFWQYENNGFNFSKRSISGLDEVQLNNKLNEAFKSNPLGIISIKEVHLTISESAKNDWIKLLGEPENQQWSLKQNPIIKYDISEQSIGLDSITIQVVSLKTAYAFLTQNNIPFKLSDSRIELDRLKFYELNIVIEE